MGWLFFGCFLCGFRDFFAFGLVGRLGIEFSILSFYYLQYKTSCDEGFFLVGSRFIDCFNDPCISCSSLL